MVELTIDEIEEILYLARIDEKIELETYISDLSHTHHCEPASVLYVAVEETSRNTVLHYAAANGHVGKSQVILNNKRSLKTHCILW